MFAPADVPQPVVATLGRAMLRAVRAPAFADLLRTETATPLFIGPEDLSGMLARDFERCLPIIYDAMVRRT